MNYTYISLGTQCTTPFFFDKIGVKSKSLPFDWMLSTPEFVYTILKLLLVDNLDINEIIDNYFFICNKRASIMKNNMGKDIVERYITSNNGSGLVNSKYGVCFPHDKLSDRDKYVRRMTRLKELILDKHNYLYFTYISVSSKDSGNYTLDGKEPIQDLYIYLQKISEIIRSVTDNYKIIVFDTTTPDNLVITDNHIITQKIMPKHICWDVLHEVVYFYELMVTNKQIIK
jgi:hypothetical protein